MEECVPSTTYRFQAASDRIVSVTLAADSIVTPVELALSRHILSWMFNGKTSLRGCRVLQLMSSSGSLVGLVAARLGGEVTIFAPAQPPSLLWNIEQNSSLTQCCCDGSSSLPSSELCAKSGLVKLVSDLSSGIATPFDVVLACYGDEHWNSVSSSAMVSWLIAVTHPGSHVFLAAASGSMGICGFLETIGSVFTVKSTASSGVTLFMLTRATDDGKPAMLSPSTVCTPTLACTPVHTAPATPAVTQPAYQRMLTPHSSHEDATVELKSLTEADEIAQLLFSMRDSPEPSRMTAAIAASGGITSPTSQQNVPSVACFFHKQQSDAPGQLRDGTTRAVISVPLSREWFRALYATLDAGVMRSLEARDKRKNSLGQYVCETLFANGVNISFHPTEAVTTVIGSTQFDHVRGKAGREPLLLLRLDEGTSSLHIQIYRANLPLSRDIKALYRLSRGTMVVRVSLWERYVAFSDPFEVKAKQQAGEYVPPVQMKEFVDLGSVPCHDPKLSLPRETAQKRQRFTFSL